MKAGMRRWLAVLMMAVAPGLAAAAQTVHDLGAVKGAIRQPEGKRSFADQIEGTAAPGPLGTALPVGLTREAIVRLVAPGIDPSRITLVGAKRWPHLADGFVAIVCAAPDAAAGKLAGASAPSCDDRPDIFLGVLALPPGGSARLVARTPPGFVPTSDWSPPAGAPILLPSVVPNDPDELARGRGDEDIAGFDLAPYRVAPDAFAFGLRGDRQEGYAGGYGSFETLHLFLVDGGALRRVLAQPIYGFQMLAGEWNKDGTRQHSVAESKLVVAVAPSLTAGHYDLRVSESGTRHRAMLHWNAARNVYWVPDEAP